MEAVSYISIRQHAANGSFAVHIFRELLQVIGNLIGFVTNYSCVIQGLAQVNRKHGVSQYFPNRSLPRLDTLEHLGKLHRDELGVLTRCLKSAKDVLRI